MTSGGCGLTWPSESAKWDRQSCGWKMSQALFTAEDLNTCSLTLPHSVMTRNGVVSPQKMLVTAISARGFSFSPGTPVTALEDSSSWPTPNTCPEAPNNSTNRGDGQHRARNTTQCLGEAAAKIWQTPGTDSFRCRGGDRKDEMVLDQQARKWPTPTSEPDAPNTNSNQVNGFTSLTEAAKWATPRANAEAGPDYAKAQRSTTGESLQTQVTQWPTPAARDFRSGEASDETMERNSRPLNEFVTNTWQTPRSHETGNYTYDHGNKEKPCVTLTGQSLLFALDQETPPPGSASSPSTHGSHPQPPSMRLNPFFVEYLMAWPPGWTIAHALNAYGYLETVFTPWLQRQRSLFSRIARCIDP
jgi:hypothetical protein